MTGVILVGGRGTRLRPLTFSRPKPLVPLVNRPFLEYQLDLLRRHGVDEVVLCVSYQARQLMRHFAGGDRFGLTIRYATEKEPLGTAGALKNAASLITGDGPVVVLNGDILTDLDLDEILETHRRQGALVTLTLVEVEDPTRYGLVILDRSGQVQRFLEKPTWDEVTARTISAGIYILEPSVFDFIPPGREVSVERETFPQLLAQGVRVSGHVTPGYWLDIGTPDKYLQAHWDILDRKVSVPIRGTELSPGVWVGNGVRISPRATLLPPVVLGDRVSVTDRARVGPYVVLGDGTVVGEEAALTRSVTGRRCGLRYGAQVRDAVLDTRTRVAEGALVDGLLLASGSVVGRGTRPLASADAPSPQSADSRGRST